MPWRRAIRARAASGASIALGLAGAVIEGWLSSSAELVAVIDGDLQHDKSILPKMYEALAAGRGNLAIGTRVADEATPGGLSPARQKLSDLGAWFFRRVAGVAVRDPMSGFFMIRREIVSPLAPRLSPDGFKILVDVILSSHGDLKIVETPYVFRKRQAGESKLSPLVGLDFIGLVAHHATGGLLPIRFVLFASIGAIGLVVHLLVLMALIEWLGPANFVASQIAATLTAMASNFLLNNEITYRAHRYRGFGLHRRLRAIRAAVQRRRARQYRHRLVAFRPRARLVGGGSGGRLDRRRLELRRELDHRLAQTARGLRCR